MVGRLEKVSGIVCALCLFGLIVLMLPSVEPGRAEAAAPASSAAEAAQGAVALNALEQTSAIAPDSAISVPAIQPAVLLETAIDLPYSGINLHDIENRLGIDELPVAEVELDVSDDMTGKMLERIPEKDGLTTFVLPVAANANTEKPSLGKKRARAIKQSVRDLKEAGYDCGFVFLDLASGKGIARNAGELFYSASAFKAAFVLYVLKDEKGKDLSEYDRSNIESAIRYSSNGAYDSLAQSRMGRAYNEWLDGYDIDFDSSMPYYADASAKSMARIWADLYQYLQTGSKNAKWFGKLLAETNRSFIRSNLKGKNVTVRNKAGWIGDSEYSATTDCAYIDDDGHPYLMVVLTDQPDSDAANRRAGQVVKALFAARKSLK